MTAGSLYKVQFMKCYQIHVLQVLLEGACVGLWWGWLEEAASRMSGAEYLDGGGCRSAKNDCNASMSLLEHCSFSKAGSVLSGSCSGFPNRLLGSFRLESSSRGFANSTTE